MPPPPPNGCSARIGSHMPIASVGIPARRYAPGRESMCWPLNHLAAGDVPGQMRCAGRLEVGRRTPTRSGLGLFRSGAARRIIGIWDAELAELGSAGLTLRLSDKPTILPPHPALDSVPGMRSPPHSRAGSGGTPARPPAAAPSTPRAAPSGKGDARGPSLPLASDRPRASTGGRAVIVGSRLPVFHRNRAVTSNPPSGEPGHVRPRRRRPNAKAELERRHIRGKIVLRP